MPRLRPTTQEWLWEETAHAVAQGRPLAEAFREIAASSRSSSRRNLATQLAQGVESGRPLSAVIEELDGIFPPGTAAAIEAGEKTGNMTAALDALADAAIQSSQLRDMVMSAVAYPIVIAFAAAAVLSVVTFYIRPMFMDMFRDMDIPLPYGTILMPYISFGAVFILLAPSLAFIFIYGLPSRLGRLSGLDAVRLKVPIIGWLLKLQLLSRWCDMMNTMVRAGVTEQKAVILAGRSTGNKRFEEECKSVAGFITRGFTIGYAIDACFFFPRTLAWMLRASQHVGSHAHVWPAARDIYIEQGDQWARIVSVLLRVFFMVIAFVTVAFAVASLFLPMVTIMHFLG